MATTHNLYLNSHDLAEALKAAVLFVNTSNHEAVSCGDGIAAVCLHLHQAIGKVDVVGMSPATAYCKKLDALQVGGIESSLPNDQLLIPWEVVSLLLKYTPRRAVAPVSLFEVTVPDGNTNRQEVKFTGADGSSHIFQTLELYFPDYASLFAKGLKMKEEPQPKYHRFVLMSEQIKRLAKVIGKEQALRFYFGDDTFCYIEYGHEDTFAQILLAQTLYAE